MTEKHAFEMEAEDRFQLGWDAAVSLITPIPRTRLPARFLTMRVINSSWQLARARELGLIRTQPIDESLRTLNHLHVARWSLVWRLPSPGAAAPERGRHSLLLFTSHFDFGWQRYLGTFIETTGDGLSHLWGDIPEWRNPSDGGRQFENFVVDQQVPHGHLYAAFPEFSCNDIRNQLRLHYEVQGLRAMVGPDDLPSAAARKAFAKRVQHCLSFSPARPERNPATSVAVTRSEKPHGLTCIVPYDHMQEPALRDALDQLKVGIQSPFAAIPGTHFARLALIGRDHFVKRSVPPLANGYLLVSAEIDGEISEWLEQLSAQSDLDDVWQHCHGYRGFASLPRLLEDCRIRPDIEYFDYPGATVAEIVQAIDTVENDLDEVLDVRL